MTPTFDKKALSRASLCIVGSWAALLVCGHAGAGSRAPPDRLVIPEVAATKQRSITISDMSGLRRVDSLSVSPAGDRFAIFVRQGDPQTNSFRTAWFVGSTRSGTLLPAGDGGEVGLDRSLGGRTVGTIERRLSRWSPDGQWIAYPLRRNGELQLWVSKADGTQRQLTRNAADVQDFRWSDDGTALYFSVGLPRAQLREREEKQARQGYHYDSELYYFSDLMLPQIERPQEGAPTVWVVTLLDGRERLAEESERAAFRQAQSNSAAPGAVGLPEARADGALAWIKRLQPYGMSLRVTTSTREGDERPCAAAECSGFIRNVWWSEDGERVLFWRNEGVLHASYGFYAWSPANGQVASVLRALDDTFQLCSRMQADRLVCVRETPTRPVHLVVIDLRSGALHELADLNPEFRNIRLGQVERIEWDTPTFPWSEPGGALADLYPQRAFGYILYPPDFDPSRKYPVFIEPYAATGFDNQAGAEHPLHVYAAHGIVVLNTQFPMPLDAAARLGGAQMKQELSAALGFPRLAMFSQSTVRALDTAAARGFIDPHRVGIGGVSHGAFVPLYMLMKQDRIAAISIASPHRGKWEYYAATAKGREFAALYYGEKYEDWMPDPEGEGRAFWRQLDLADHVDAIEAPILMNLPAMETFGVVELTRRMAAAGKPYDAYVYRDETHIKWQPAHVRTIMERNLDWFRFWLQDQEDADPAKSEQYARWRKLRTLHRAQRAAN